MLNQGRRSALRPAIQYLLDAALRPDGGGLYAAKSTAMYLASVGEPLLTG